MPRPARLVCPGVAHHITQRGNKRNRIFFTHADARAYLDLVGHGCAAAKTRCLAWCLMPNHVHLILVPSDQDGLRAVLGPAHSRYSQRRNSVDGSQGHVFQGRFASYPMDDAHLMAAVRYVENNPVIAGLVDQAEAWQWSSARAHLTGEADGLTDSDAIGQHVPNWRAYLEAGVEAAGRNDEIEAAFRSGKPLGNAPRR